MPKTEIINAVLNMNLKEFKRLIRNRSYRETLLNPIVINEECHYSVPGIIQCWEEILKNPEEWDDSVKGRIAKMKEANLKMKSFFEKKLGVDFTHQYWLEDGARPVYFWDEDDLKYHTDCTREELIAKGIGEIDIDLFVAMQKYELDKVQELLDAGANPIFEFETDDEHLVDWVGIRCAHDELDLHKVFSGERKAKIDIEAEDFEDLHTLFHLAPSDRLYSMVEKYIPE